MSNPEVRALADAVARLINDGAWMDEVPSPAVDAVGNVLDPILMALLCQHAGHDVVSDNCGMPEHDYCIRCQQRFPGQSQDRLRQPRR